MPEILFTRTKMDSPTRREQFLAAAARLFAERGFHGVTIEELGAAIGISGPALYKHFANKDAILGEMLVSISAQLLEQGRREVEFASTPSDALDRLLTFHTKFALTRPDLIRVQDRDLVNLSRGEAQKVRRLQRAYVELWIDALIDSDPSLDRSAAHTKVLATFGLLNSTPHSAKYGMDVGAMLKQMARAALETSTS